MENVIVECEERAGRYLFAVRSEIGTREEQQDCAFIGTQGERLLAVVCDGMGGEAGGRAASETAVSSVRGAFAACPECGEDGAPGFLRQALISADKAVTARIGRGAGGTTMAAALLCGGSLFWLSCGDSRIYILRAGELLQVTRDHNYLLRLSEQLKRGDISPEEYQNRLERGDALISFVGMGGIELYDLTRTGLPLQQGDLLLITTDGVYRFVPEDEIRSVLMSGSPLDEKADLLMGKAMSGDGARDNATFVLIGVQ